MRSDETDTAAECSGDVQRNPLDGTASISQRRRASFTVVLLLVLGPFIGLALVVGSQLVPDETIIDRLLDGQSTGELSSVDYPVSSFGNMIDKFSECATLTVGLDEIPGTNPITSAMRSYIASINCPAIPDSLAAVREGVPPETGVEYYRYWHGYSVVTRPLLLLSQISVLRVIVVALIIIPLCLLSIRIGRLFGWLALVSLLFPYVVVTDFVDLAQSIPHGIAAAAALWCTLLGVHRVSRRPAMSEATIIAVAGGIVIAFFDILIVAPTTLCLTAALTSAIIYSHSRSIRASLLTGSIASVTWIVSYCWMWSAKWVLTMPFEGVRPVIDNIRGAATYRLDGARADVDPAFGASLVKNLNFWIDRPLGSATLVVAAGLLVFVASRHARPRAVVEQTVSVALVPVVCVAGWFVAFSNHTQVHLWLTYRTVGVAIGVILFAATMRPATVRTGPNLTARSSSGLGRRDAEPLLVDGQAPRRG